MPPAVCIRRNSNHSLFVSSFKCYRSCAHCHSHDGESALAGRQHICHMAKPTAKLLLKNAKRKCCHISPNNRKQKFSTAILRVLPMAYYIHDYIVPEQFLHANIHFIQLRALVCDLNLALIAGSLFLQRYRMHTHCWLWMMNNLEIASIFHTMSTVFSLFDFSRVFHIDSLCKHCVSQSNSSAIHSGFLIHGNRIDFN